MDENGNHIGRISLIIIIALILLLLIRMGILQSSQTINRKRYSDPIVSTALVRGTIYDRNGNILALQAPDYGFYINISKANSSYIASIIAPYLPYDALTIENMINEGKTFFPLSFIPTKDESNYIQKLLANLALDKEVVLELKESRKYPLGSNVKSLIGDVDEHMNGVSGIEKIYNSSLEAKPALGLDIIRGSSLVLTIDIELQNKLYDFPNLDDYENSTIAILSENNEILAYKGDISEAIINAMVYSITDSETTRLLNNENPLSGVPTNQYGHYKVYVESPSNEVKDSILYRIETILKAQGRISS